MVLAAVPALLGAGLGGIEGYRRSGGDLGAALLGAGIGAAGGAYLPAGIRMAGQALGGLPLVSQGISAATPTAYQAAKGLSALKAGQGLKGATEAMKTAGSLAQFSGATNPTVQAVGRGALSKALAGSAMLGGTLALPGLAGGAASVLSAPVRAVTGGIGQVGQQGTGMLAQGLGGYQSNYGANLPGGVPQVDQYGNVVPMGMPSDVLGLPGIGRTLESQRSGRAMAENLQRYGDVQLAFREAAARKDFERQAAMKGIAQNIATNAAMLQNAQIGAQNLGQTFGTGVANTLGQIYQYQ